jgi:hypothetical protein
MNAIISKMITCSGRSWWQARYTDGRIVSEWDTVTEKLKLPLGLSGFSFGKSSRWEELSKKGMIGLRLLCPNGQAGELEALESHHFFQLKSGSVDVGFGGMGGHPVAAHVIGVVDSIDGDCLCYTWESYEQVTCPEYELALAKVGHVVTPNDIQQANATLSYWRQRGCGKWKWQLRQFRDNVFHMTYQGIGALEHNVQQVKV